MAEYFVHKSAGTVRLTDESLQHLTPTAREILQNIDDPVMKRFLADDPDERQKAVKEFVERWER